MPKQIVFIYTLVCLIASVFTYAQAPKFSNEFLSIGVGARAHGMGLAVTSLAHDGTATYWNPAGIAHLGNAPILTAMHAEWFGGIGKYDFGSIAIPLNAQKQAAMGISVIRFGVDNIPNTLNLVNPDGSVNFDNVTEFSAADYAALLSYGQKIHDKLSIGGNVKIIRRIVGTFADSWGFGADIGIQYQPTKSLQLGLMARDITTTFNAWSMNFTQKDKETFALTGNTIPENSTEITRPRIILSGAYDIVNTDRVRVTGALDMDWTTDGQRNVLISSKAINIDPHVGVEATYKEIVFLRGGVRNMQRVLAAGETDKKVLVAAPTVGVGFKYKVVSLDYALTTIGTTSQELYSHVFSLAFDLSAREKKVGNVTTE